MNKYQATITINLDASGKNKSAAMCAVHQMLTKVAWPDGATPEVFNVSLKKVEETEPSTDAE